MNLSRMWLRRLRSRRNEERMRMVTMLGSWYGSAKVFPVISMIGLMDGLYGSNSCSEAFEYATCGGLSYSIRAFEQQVWMSLTVSYEELIANVATRL